MNIINEKINRFAIGDEFQYNIGTHDEPVWTKFWNNPIRDKEDVVMARDLVETKGACLHPIFVKLPREYRSKGY